MTMNERHALAVELGRVEVALQRAYAAMDGSVESRTRLARAKEEYRRAEAAALHALGAEDALKLVEATDSPCAHTLEQEALRERVGLGARGMSLLNDRHHA
ncbi:hypothetical protein MFUL124B02_08420 [Myxococcus fulvus 124B02]|nr:hypothetical protein MFUL124B02_08420 [Myxococcus fulvus 124B02]